MPSLSPVQGPLGTRKAKHLLRRTTFKFNKENIDLLKVMTAADAVSHISTNSTNILDVPYDHGTGNYFNTSSNISGRYIRDSAVDAWWWYNAQHGLTIKHSLTLFLHTSFSAPKNHSSGNSNSEHYVNHIKLLEFYAMGNIKTFAKKVTRDWIMSTFLGNTYNKKNSPNENYAREFLELFTIMKGPQVSSGDYTNYTELDVQMAAKVLTGFKRPSSPPDIDSDTGLPIGFQNVSQHDTNDKTFSSAFGNQVIIGQSTSLGMIQELDDFVEMIFSQQETARAYCRKLYRFFVKSEWGQDVENDIIEPLAQDLYNNGYEILPVVQRLISSQHFYDEDDGDNTNNTIGAIVKSPLNLMSEVFSMFQVSFPNPTVMSNLEGYYKNLFKWYLSYDFFFGAGMGLFSPDEVAGYPAYYQSPLFDRHWFSSTTIIARYGLVSKLISGGNIEAQLDTIFFVENNISNPSDVTDLITEISELLYPENLDIDRIQYFSDVLLGQNNQYYWTNAWSDYITNGIETTVKSRLDTLIIAMVNAPEFQLM